MFESAVPAAAEAGACGNGKAGPGEGLLLLEALALFRDGHPESGMRCIRQLQESRRLQALVELLCPGFAAQHDHRAQHIRRAILDPGGARDLAAAGVQASNDAAPLPAARGTAALTPKQRLVLELVRDGLTNRQIAARMQVSENTVKWHLKALSRQLGAGNRCSVIRIAEQRRLIPPRAGAARTDAG